MDNKRMINTKFWSDSYISELDPIEKLLYLYLITNERVNLCGIYELPLKFMSLETGIEKEMLTKIIGRFETDEKIFMVNGFIIIKNFIKNQNIESPSIQTGITRRLNDLPLEIRKSIENQDTVWGRCIHGVVTVWGKGKGKGKGTKREMEMEKESASDTPFTTTLFEEFWGKYPKKIKKTEAKTAWMYQKMESLSRESFEEILDFCASAALTDAWHKGFIPNPDKFISGRRWEDDLATYGDFEAQNTGSNVIE